MDLKDNYGHDPQTPAVDFKLREGQEMAFIKRDTEGTELLPPHRVALFREKQRHPPDESGSQNMVPREGSAFGNTRTEPSMGHKEACPNIFFSRSSQSCTRTSGKRGRGWLLAGVRRLKQESTTKIT